MDGKMILMGYQVYVVYLVVVEVGYRLVILSLLLLLLYNMLSHLFNYGSLWIIMMLIRSAMDKSMVELGNFTHFLCLLRANGR